MKTPKSLLSLLGGVIDYAGLFPPASLDLDASVRNFAAYKTERRSWMLDTFVCPYSRLEDLYRYVDLLRANAPHRVSVLGPAGDDAGQWRAGLQQVTRAVDEFRSQMGDVAVAAVAELKMPQAIATEAGQLDPTVLHIRELNDAIPEADIFLEIVPAAEPRAVTDVAAALNRLPRSGKGRFGLKLRTGGVVPESIPESEAVAAFVCTCRDSGVRFKATAGLHHPFYHYSDAVGANMHGFLNLFVGAMLAHTNAWPVDTLASFLELDTFDIDASDDELVVAGQVLSTEEIKHLRDHLVVSFGSCSFDEPWNDLVTLKLVA